MTLQKPPFTALAQFYDAMMADMEYELWAEFVLDYLREKNVKPRALLDVACGTGNSTKPFVDAGLAVVGIDASLEMLAVAEQKLPHIEFYQANMLSFQLAEQFDVVCCLFDSLNNLLTSAEVEQALSTMHQHLHSGGYLVADVNTRLGVKELWDDDTIEGVVHTTDGSEVHYHWTHHYDPQTELATIQAFFRTEQGEYIEHHTERGYDPEELLQLCTRAGFSQIEIVEYPDYQPATSHSPRVWVFARKSA